MIQIVNGLLVSDGTILMARRSQNRAHYANTWSFPGGHVEGGETLDRAIAREMREEVGVMIKAPLLMDFKAIGTERKGLVTFHFFIIHRWTGTIQNLGVEHSEIRWVSLAEAPSLPNLALPA